MCTMRSVLIAIGVWLILMGVASLVITDVTWRTEIWKDWSEQWHTTQAIYDAHPSIMIALGAVVILWADSIFKAPKKEKE
jgi:nitrate reductase gamma subunit